MGMVRASSMILIACFRWLSNWINLKWYIYNAEKWKQVLLKLYFILKIVSNIASLHYYMEAGISSWTWTFSTVFYMPCIVHVACLVLLILYIYNYTYMFVCLFVCFAFNFLSKLVHKFYWLKHAKTNCFWEKHAKSFHLGLLVIDLTALKNNHTMIIVWDECTQQHSYFLKHLLWHCDDIVAGQWHCSHCWQPPAAQWVNDWDANGSEVTVLLAVYVVAM